MRFRHQGVFTGPMNRDLAVACGHPLVDARNMRGKTAWLRAGLLFLAFLPPFIAPGFSLASSVRLVVRDGNRIRAVMARKEGDELMVPLLACGSILEADARWNPRTNRWEMNSAAVNARGFLDEPLLMIGGQPVLVKNPPRLLGGTPYLSLETLRTLGRHGCDIEVEWNESAGELTIRPAQALQVSAAERTRKIAVPVVAPGRHVIVLDAGHERRAGARGSRGITEGEIGMALATAVSATLSPDEFAAIIMQGDGEGLDPREVASVANSAGAEIFISFHASEYGSPGIGIWCWGLSNLIGTAVTFDPFGAADGWVRSSSAAAARSAAFGRRLIKSLTQAELPVSGPWGLPLTALEGTGCPAIVVTIEGISAPEGTRLVTEEGTLARLAAAIATAVRGEIGP
jgi:N-acetylmuramoyl-L-alanine amidase